MSDSPAEPATLPPEIADIYEQFTSAMRAGDLETAALVAPSVVLADGAPDHDTGPLYSEAFQSDERYHALLAWYPRPNGQVLLRSGTAWFVVARSAHGYEIVDAGLKPID